MSYQANPAEDARIRQRIREILNEKISDRTYKGESLIGGKKYKESARVKRDRAERKKYENMVNMLGGVKKKKKRKEKKYVEPKIKESFWKALEESTGRKIRKTPARVSPLAKDFLQKHCFKVKNPARIHAGMKASKTNPWIQFYREWVNTHPKMSGAIASKLAAQDYRAQNPIRIKALKEAVAKASKTNPWIEFYREWRKNNPEITGKSAIKLAAQEYRSQAGKGFGRDMYEYY
jgi:hypothetical protein